MPILRFVMCAALLLALSACRREAPAASAEPAPAPAPAATTPVAAAQPADATLVLPGAFAEATTVADLEKMFGKQNIKTSEVRDDDGQPIRSLVLFPDDPTRRAYVSFHDAEHMTGLANILVKDAGSLWRGKQNSAGRVETTITQAVTSLLGLCELGLVRWKPSLSDCVGAVAVKR